MGELVPAAFRAQHDVMHVQVLLEDFLEKWVPGMKRDGRLVAVFMTCKQKGVVVDPDRLREDLEVELQNYDS